MADATARALTLVSELTSAIGREIDALDLSDSIAWPDLPTVEAMVLHVGNIHRWVSAVVRSRSAVAETSAAPTPGAHFVAWYSEGRTALLDALSSASAQDPCWILGSRPGDVSFWHRRMIYENAKHLMDLRATGGRPWVAADELSTADYADGIDELFEVFLPRSRPRLAALPAAIVLLANDSDRGWRVDHEWNVSSAAQSTIDGHAARISARTSDLALALWERADLRDCSRFTLEGDPTAIEALASTSIHPW